MNLVVYLACEGQVCPLVYRPLLMNHDLHGPGCLLSSLSIVLPCYNEEANLEATILHIQDAARSVTADYEIVIVDDGSRDRTAEIALSWRAKDLRIRLFQHAKNRGYGAALRTGFKASIKHWVFYTDADGQFDVRELPRIVKLLHRHDVVSCYRRARADGWVRSMLGWIWTRIVGWILQLDLRDVDCAFKIYPRRLFDRIEIRSHGALVDAEVLYKARGLGLSIGQAGVRHFPRRAGRQTGADVRVIARAVAELGKFVFSSRRELTT